MSRLAIAATISRAVESGVRSVIARLLDGQSSRLTGNALPTQREFHRPAGETSRSPPPPEQRPRDHTEQHQAGADGDALEEVLLGGGGRWRGREDLAGDRGSGRGR